MKALERYEIWSEKVRDPKLSEELNRIAGDEAEIESYFYRELEFGTGGLRGVLGVGTNRMNLYTVRKATQGYSNYLKSREEAPRVAIAYDSRINSTLFARMAAEVFAANGIRTYNYPRLMPTPSLSFAVRDLECSGGIVPYLRIYCCDHETLERKYPIMGYSTIKNRATGYSQWLYIFQEKYNVLQKAIKKSGKHHSLRIRVGYFGPGEPTDKHPSLEEELD